MEMTNFPLINKAAGNLDMLQNKPGKVISLGPRVSQTLLGSKRWAAI